MWSFFGRDNVEDWKYMFKILNTFCLSSGMDINPEKYVFFHHIIFYDVREEINYVFGYSWEPQENGFKHIGFFKKPNFYMKIDWMLVSEAVWQKYQ